MVRLMKVDTELKALRMAQRLWKFLADTGLQKKHFHPNIESRYDAGCPLCEFYHHLDPNKPERAMRCAKCPLWPKHLCNFAGCDSAYIEWTLNARSYEYSGTEKAKSSAKILHDAITEAIKKIKDKGETV